VKNKIKKDKDTVEWLASELGSHSCPWSDYYRNDPHFDAKKECLKCNTDWSRAECWKRLAAK
jgi:hypothetical protein